MSEDVDIKCAVVNANNRIVAVDIVVYRDDGTADHYTLDTSERP